MILSYEEKKAINNMKLFARVHQDMTVVTANEMNIVLNVIEKQQKEIEELKEKIKTFKIEDENIYLQFGEIIEKKRWKDKIKAKIEEIDKVLNEDIYVIDGHYDDRYYRYLQDKKVLRSLLEKGVTNEYK